MHQSRIAEDRKRLTINSGFLDSPCIRISSDSTLEHGTTCKQEWGRTDGCHTFTAAQSSNIDLIRTERPIRHCWHARVSPSATNATFMAPSVRPAL